MTNKDIDRIDKLISRYNKLPQSAEFKVIMLKRGKPTEEEKTDSIKVFDEINDIFREIRTFVKVKIEEPTAYLVRCHEIKFEAKVKSIPIDDEDARITIRVWEEGMREFNNLLKDLRLEVSMLVEEIESKQQAKNSIVDSQTTNISNSNVILGKVEKSTLSSGTQKSNSHHENKGPKNPDPPTNKWQKIAVFSAIAIAVIGILLRHFEII